MASIMRYEVFVIAQAGEYYRHLASFHNLDVSSSDILRQALLLIRILSHPRNRIPLQQELRLAKKSFSDEPPPSSSPSSLRLALSSPSNYHCPFPFLTTCLLVGLSLDTEKSRVKLKVYHDLGPGTISHNRMNRNDRIMVLDITDLDDIKYCFTMFEAQGDLRYSQQRGGTNVENQSGPKRDPPHISAKRLNGWDCLRLLDQPPTQGDILIANKFQDKTLIPIPTLSETWPWILWGTTESPTVRPTTSPRKLKGLIQLVMEKLVSEIDSPDVRPRLDLVKEFIDHIPHVRPVLRDVLFSMGDKIGKTLESLSLLPFAYEGEQHLDWSAFTNLDTASLLSVLQGMSLQGTRSLTLCPAFSLAPAIKELGPSLALLHRSDVYLLEPPSRSDNWDCTDTLIDLVSSIPQSGISRLIMSSLMAQAFEPLAGLPKSSSDKSLCLTSSFPLIPSFPVVQLLVSHYYTDEDPIWRYLEEVVFLGDAFLSPTRAVTGLIRFIECLSAKDGPEYYKPCNDAAVCFAASSSTLLDTEAGEINMLPAEVLNARRDYHVGSGSFRFEKLCDLIPGQWMILVEKITSRPAVSGADSTTRFRYAFVRSRRTIQFTSYLRGVPNLKPDDLDACSFEEFLQELEVGVDTSSLEPLIARLKQEIGERFSTGLNSEIQVLTRLEREEICAILGRSRV